MSNFFTKKNITIIVIMLLAILAIAFLFTNVSTTKMGDESKKSGESIFSFEKAEENINNFNFNGMLTKVMAIVIIVVAAAVVALGAISFAKPELTKFLKIALIALAVVAVVYFIAGFSMCQSAQKAVENPLVSISVVPGIGIVLPFAFGLVPVAGLFLLKD